MSNSIFRKDGTAQGVAKQRLIETLAGPDRRVINDPYAEKFIMGAGLMKLMGHKLNTWLSQNLHLVFMSILLHEQNLLMI